MHSVSKERPTTLGSVHLPRDSGKAICPVCHTRTMFIDSTMCQVCQHRQEEPKK